MKNKKKVTVTSVPNDKTTTIKVSGSFYGRLNNLLVRYGDSISEKDLTFAINQIKTGHSEQNPFAYDLETLMILLKEIEDSFKTQGDFIENEVEIEVANDNKKKG